jgi:hypothetical protein
MLEEFKMLWALLRSKPQPHPAPFAVTERLGYLWGVYSGSVVVHASVTYRGAENWRLESIRRYYEINGWDKYKHWSEQ